MNKNDYFFYGEFTKPKNIGNIDHFVEVNVIFKNKEILGPKNTSSSTNSNNTSNNLNKIFNENQ